MIFNYIRVSTADQNTDRQLIGVHCDRVYEEKVSGKNKDRPQLQAMLLNLRSGDLVNVHELSRLARNTKDLLEIVQQILSAGASIKFHKENLFFQSNEKTDPFQNLMLTMLGAIAQFERDLMLERQREGIAIAKAKGKYKGRQTRFNKDEMQRMKSEFQDAKNKAAIARNWGISRQYLYKLVANG
jgi:DNA invertase Pin-like site-specific DNA recombinase